MLVCARCHQENRPEARFCDACGAPLTEATPREERKVISVLFADLVGSTTTAEGMDPEDVRALQDPYWQHVRSELERHGGTVEKFIGDAVVALFGAPTAHEDDPERAIRAALAIRDWAREQDAIQVRIGVTTGEALVRLGARPLAGEAMASGDVVNTASRLQTAAPANAVLVDETTRRATRAAIEFGEAQPVVAKGKAEAIRAWEAFEARSRFGVDLFQHARTELVGRGLELGVFRGALTRMREERSPQLVTIVGVPGIGKSRLVYELMRLVEADNEIVTWRQGRSLPYGDGVSFWALAEIVKAQAGILESDTDAEVQPKLAHAVRAVVDDAAEAAWIERHLRPLVGVAGEGEATPGTRSSEAFAAWCRFFEALADRRPAVIVFEDLHWADEALLEFVDSLVERTADVPLLIIATTRPELLDRRPAWGGGKANSTTLSLAPLSANETLQLVRALAEDLPADAEQTLVEHAAGNALYAEQYVQMWTERGETHALPLPETVHGLIAARLDGLPPDEKGVLQNAAVFGKVFWQGAVVAVEGIDAERAGECLLALQRKQFVQRARRSSVEDESEYAFRHVLVRDVAYAQIPRVDRVDKHERAAAWIESLGRPDDHAEMLAHHYAHALELKQASGRTSDNLRDRARSALLRAGEHGLAVHAFGSAAGYFEQALELLEEADPQRPAALFGLARALFASGADERAEALETARDALIGGGDSDRAAEAEALLAEVWWFRGKRDEVDRRLGHALALVAGRPTSEAKARVLAEAARFRMLAGEYERAIALAHEVLELAGSLRLPNVRAESLITLGAARYFTGEVTAGTGDVKRGLELALEHNELRTAARGYRNLSNLTEDVGEQDKFLTAAAEIDRRLGDMARLQYTRAALVQQYSDIGRWDDALRVASEFIAECESGGNHYSEAWVRTARALIRLARDETESVLDEVDRAVVLAREGKDPQLLFGALGAASRVNTELGRIREARELADEAIAAGPDAAIRSFDFVFVAHRLGVARKLLQMFGDVHPEKRLDNGAVAFLDERFEDAARIFDDIREHDSAAYARLRGADALHAQGRSKEAASIDLAKALSFYRSVGAIRYVREAEELLRSFAGAHTQSTVR